MNPREQVDSLLAEHGAVLLRNKKHEIWKLPNGQRFTRGMTPSDKKADANSLSDLKHALGIVKTEAIVGERRERVIKRKVEQKIKYDRPVNTLAGRLPSSLVEDALRSEVEQQQREISRLLTLRDALQIQADNCRWCRLKKWWHKHVEGTDEAAS